MPTFLGSCSERENDVCSGEDGEHSFNACTPKPVGALIRGEKRDSSVIKYKITATPGYIIILHWHGRNFALKHALDKKWKLNAVFYIISFSSVSATSYYINKEWNTWGVCCFPITAHPEVFYSANTINFPICTIFKKILLIG